MAKRKTNSDAVQLMLEGSEEPRQPSSSDNRLTAAAAKMYEDESSDPQYLHAGMAQCGLPYRKPDPAMPFYERRNGSTTLILTPGVLLDPKTHRPAMQGIPYGAKPRLLLIYLCTEATLRKSPEVEIAHSMSGFMQDLGLAVTGGATGSIGRFKEQLNRLAATRMQLLFQDENKVSIVNPSSPIHRYDIWFPKHPSQKMLWPTTITLSGEFFDSLMAHALPLNSNAVRGLQSSAMALDVYAWLVHRLCRIRGSEPVNISWFALQNQFGTEYRDQYKFRQDFKQALAKVLALYREAKVELTHDGKLQLRQSPSPVARRTLKLG